MCLPCLFTGRCGTRTLSDLLVLFSAKWITLSLSTWRRAVWLTTCEPVAVPSSPPATKLTSQGTVLASCPLSCLRFSRIAECLFCVSLHRIFGHKMTCSFYIPWIIWIELSGRNWRRRYGHSVKKRCWSLYSRSTSILIAAKIRSRIEVHSGRYLPAVHLHSRFQEKCLNVIKKWHIFKMVIYYHVGFVIEATSSPMNPYLWSNKFRKFCVIWLSSFAVTCN